MIRITAPHFVAGIEVLNGTVVKAAPIMKWTIGESERKVINWCLRKGFEVEEIEELTEPFFEETAIHPYVERVARKIAAQWLGARRLDDVTFETMDEGEKAYCYVFAQAAVAEVEAIIVEERTA